MSVINGRTNAVTHRIRVGEIIATAVNQQTDTIYAGGAADGNLAVINGRTNKVTGSLVLNGVAPSGIVINPQTSTVYTADSLTNTVSVLASTCT